MAEIQKNQAGEEYVLEGGRWRRLTPQEQQIRSQGPVETFSEAARTLMSAGASGFSAIASGFGAPHMSEEFLRRGGEKLQHLGNLQRFRPIATGNAIGSLEFLLASPALVGLSRSGRAARQTARQTVQEAGEAVRASDAAQEAVQEVGDLVGTYAPDSAGAAARGNFWQSLRRMPRFKDMLEGIENQLGARRPLSADQAKFIRNGETARVGFQLLPGQATGNNVIAEVISRDPFLADAFDSITSANSQRLGELTARSVGLTGAEHGRDIRMLSRRSVGNMLDDVAAQIPEIELGDFAADVARLQTKRERELLDVSGPIGGRDVMDVRRLVADELAAKRSDPVLTKEVRELDELLDAIDDRIGDALPDTAVQRQWADARTRWRVVRALDRQGVVTGDGDLSLKTLVGALEREFEREFRRSSLTQGQNMPSDVTELLDYARVARTFASNLNDSGTATGNALLQAINSPASYAKKRVAAKFIADVMVNRPDLAEALPASP